uniref:hypothetical protein n=2 Tax=Vibrio TaxID=662 RepID=UPI000AB32BEE
PQSYIERFSEMGDIWFEQYQQDEYIIETLKSESAKATLIVVDTEMCMRVEETAALIIQNVNAKIARDEAESEARWKAFAQGLNKTNQELNNANEQWHSTAPQAPAIRTPVTCQPNGAYGVTCF